MLADDDDGSLEQGMKLVNMDIAMSITACACLHTHDQLGNPNEEVWAPRNVATRTSKLVEAKDMRKLLLEQIRRRTCASCWRSRTC